MIMFSFAAANAQVIYTNVIPDDTILCSGSPCTAIDSLDLDNDGNMDFLLSSYYQYLGGCSSMRPPKVKSSASITSIGSNSFYGMSSNYPSALNYGNIIDSNLIWSNGAKSLKGTSHTTCTASFNQTGNWSTLTDYYLPVKIIKSGNNYFGWIRMQIISVNYFHYEIILKDYAYNSTPNQFIVAGDKGAARVIAISTINSPLCFGSNINIGFNITENFDSTNVFTAELSDSIGGFSNPVVIGSINSNQPGNINALIPQNVSDGDAYRIRVNSSSPDLNGFDNGNNLVIYSSHPPVTINNTYGDTICPLNPYQPLHMVSVQVQTAMQSKYNYQWQLNGVDIPLGTTLGFYIDSYMAGVDTFQTFVYTVVVSNVCASDTSSPLQITVFPTIVKLDSFPDACLNDPPLILNGGSPPGGIYVLTVNGQLSGNISSVLDYTYYGAGNYGIYYETQTPDSFGCTYGQSITQYFNVNSCTGIEDNYSPASFFVSVINKKIIVHIEKNVLTDGTIGIYNTIGQEIKKVSITNNLTEIEMSKNSSGIYFITVQTKTAIETRNIYFK